MTQYIYRFVTSQAVLRAKREKNITERRAQGYRGPVGAMRLDIKDTIKAFLDYWDEVGAEGWIYCGIVEYPDLPFGGVYCFRKPKGERPIKKSGLRKVETLDEEPVDEFEFKEEEPGDMDDLVFDMSNESTKEELLNADANVVNDVLFRRQRVLSDEDPDKKSNVIDELEKSEEANNIPQPEVSQEKVRHQLYNLYETKSPGRKAVFNGKETKGFKDWLDKEKSSYDPYYKEYNVETGQLALQNEQETPEFKEWLRKKHESG